MRGCLLLQRAGLAVLPLLLAGGLVHAQEIVTVVEDFEFASDNAAAAAGVAIYPGVASTGVASSASGADASEGSFALRADVTWGGTVFDALFIERFLSAPYNTDTPIPAGQVASRFTPRLDLKGDPLFGSGAFGVNVFLILFDSDGEQYRFINFGEPAIQSSTYTPGVAINYFDLVNEQDALLTQVVAFQVILEDPDGISGTAPVFLDKLEFTEVPFVDPGSTISIDDFELATDEISIPLFWDFSSDASVTVSLLPGSLDDANEGNFSIGLDFFTPGNPIGFESGRFGRTFDTPIPLSKPYSPTGGIDENIADLLLEIDVKGDPEFAKGQGTNLWVYLYETDGDAWRFINFVEPALNAATFSDDINLGIGLRDRDASSTGDGLLSEISRYEILLQNPDFGVSRDAVAWFDDFKITEAGGGQPGLPTGLTYNVPLIDPAQAPNVTDTTFDAIWSNGGAHQVIEGDEWRDWASRAIDPGTPISANTLNPSAAAGIFASSKAYFLSDGESLYFGMVVYDPDTSLMTADSGNDTFTKFNVEDVEVALSATSGSGGPADALKVAMDAFGNIDDLMPDGPAGVVSSFVTASNSYIIDSTTWALEWKFNIADVIQQSAFNLATPLPAAPGPWWGHVGYQSPFPGPRVPLYAAGHANGFANFTVQLVLPPASVEDWTMMQY